MTLCHCFAWYSCDDDDGDDDDEDDDDDDDDEEDDDDDDGVVVNFRGAIVNLQQSYVAFIYFFVMMW